MLRKGVAALGLLLVLSGCLKTAIPLTSDPPQVYAVKDDRFSQAIEIVGQRSWFRSEDKFEATWYIRSWINKSTSSVEHQIYIIVLHNDKRKMFGNYWNYNIANDEDSNSMNIYSIGKNYYGCIDDYCKYEENIGIDIDESTLINKLNRGYSIKIINKLGGSLIIEISSSQIKVQLDEINNLKQKHSN